MKKNKMKICHFISVAVMVMNSMIIRAIDIPMNASILPDFGFTCPRGFVQTFDITHQGTNCKYSFPISVYSGLGSRWVIKISAPQMVSADGKTALDFNLVNYKIFGGESIATPSQSSNIWLPLPPTPKIIYLSSDAEMVTTKTDFVVIVFVTPRTVQFQKTFKTKLIVSIEPI